MSPELTVGLLLLRTSTIAVVRSSCSCSCAASRRVVGLRRRASVRRGGRVGRRPRGFRRVERLAGNRVLEWGLVVGHRSRLLKEMLAGSGGPRGLRVARAETKPV